MGILNLTRIVFQMGKFVAPKAAREHIRRMINSGANIIDIGERSTRPGSKTILPKNEWRRIAYTVKNFKKIFKNTCLSVDTRKPDVMKKSIKHGADLINDVSGLFF